MSTENLASITEQLQENLTGRQIVDILDSLIFTALKPIVDETNLARICISNILIQCYNDNRRKTSTLNRQKLTDKLFSSILCRNPKDRLKSLKQSKLERGLIFRILLLFMEITTNYPTQEIKWLRDKDEKSLSKMIRIEKLLHQSNKRLSSSIKWVRYYTKQYNSFKGSIMEKYIRYAYLESEKCSSASSLTIDKQELFKNLILSLDKAIDKYSSDKGALTSYIKWWWLNAKTNPEFSHEYGQGVSVSSTLRKGIKSKQADGSLCLITFAESIDEHSMDIESDYDNVEQQLELKENQKNSLNLVHQLNNIELAKLYLQIPYILSPEEINQLKAN